MGRPNERVLPLPWNTNNVLTKNRDIRTYKVNYTIYMELQLESELFGWRDCMCTATLSWYRWYMCSQSVYNVYICQQFIAKHQRVHENRKLPFSISGQQHNYTHTVSAHPIISRRSRIARGSTAAWIGVGVINCNCCKAYNIGTESSQRSHSPAD